MTGVKQDKPQWESVLFQPGLKAHPIWHSWIITAHISIGNLSKHLQMFNCQKALAQELLIKLQQQPFASNFVFNSLLWEFSNIGNIYSHMSPLFEQQNSYSGMKQSEINQWHPTTYDPNEVSPTFLRDVLHWQIGIATTKDTSEVMQWLHSLIQKQTLQQETLVHIIFILNITRCATQVNRQKINEVTDALQKANQDMNILLNVTDIVTQCLMCHQLYTYACIIFPYLRNCLTYMNQFATHMMDYVDTVVIIIIKWLQWAHPMQYLYRDQSLGNGR